MRSLRIASCSRQLGHPPDFASDSRDGETSWGVPALSPLELLVPVLSAPAAVAAVCSASHAPRKVAGIVRGAETPCATSGAADGRLGVRIVRDVALPDAALCA